MEKSAQTIISQKKCFCFDLNLHTKIWIVLEWGGKIINLFHAFRPSPPPTHFSLSLLLNAFFPRFLFGLKKRKTFKY